MADYYKVLGLDKSASQADIKEAYRKLSKKFHPDKNDGDAFFENMFKQIQEAYEILGNAEKRKRFDYQFESEQTTAHKSYSQQRDTQYQQQQAYNYQQHRANVPIVEWFMADQAYFYSGEVIKFEWKTRNADSVRIKPFGIVAPNGAKSYRLNLKKINQEFLIITIEATNQSSGKTVTQHIELRNKLFYTQDVEQKAKREEEAYVNSGGLVKEKFLSVRGRLRRKSYFIRILLLTVASVFLNAVAEESRNPDVVIFAGFVMIVCAILFAMQTIKRLHDTNYSGWYVLYGFVPILGFLLGLHALFTKGTAGPNKYGGDPRM